MMYYCVKTEAGELEITKGAYLTMMKRQNSSKLTVAKHKLICSHRCLKRTVRKWRRIYPRKIVRKCLVMKDRLGQAKVFPCFRDSKVF